MQSPTIIVDKINYIINPQIYTEKKDSKMLYICWNLLNNSTNYVDFIEYKSAFLVGDQQ